jgi:GT2 family glycosyltransferase
MHMTSIIIITYNKLAYNKLCIDSIRQYTEPGSYEIIVIDNHSTDGTVEWLQSQSDLRLILNSQNIGFPAGCNRGIAAASGNSILLLNNDTIATPQWLANLKKCLFSSSDIGAVGAVTNSCSNFQSIAYEYASIEEMILFAKQINHSNPELWEDRSRLVGYCLLIKAEVVRKIGLLDEIFSPGNFEDDDYSLRIRNAGYRLVLCRDTFIHHFGSVSFGEQAAHFAALLETNKQKFIDKWGFTPYSLPPSDQVKDPELQKWFAYQHDFNYYRQTMETAGHKFCSLLNQAEFALLSGDLEKAMLAIMRSADYAHHSHPDFFSSPRLESMLRTIAEKLSVQTANPLAVPPDKNTDKRNILHVLSQGYDAVGHTKTLERWMLMDTHSIHSIVVTLNSSTNPPWLASAAMRSGGWYLTLDTANLSFSQRAKLLRDTASMWADIVVLHIHPHDPVPPVAFGVAGGPPVIFVNHADQAFTIGMTVADLIADHRACVQSITETRTSIPTIYRLPIPLETPSALENKKIAKKNLGVNEDSIVLLTVAQPYQLIPCGEYSFSNLLTEISNRHQNITMLVIGPSQTGEWDRLNSHSNGRIRAFDNQGDLQPYYSAADIYLDSIPLASPTQALEAGAMGIPVVGLSTAIAVQLSSDIEPGSIQTHFNSREELLSVIDRLVSDPAYHFTWSTCLQSAILQNHCSGWPEHLAKLYLLVPSSHIPSEISTDEKRSSGWRDIVWVYFQQQSGLSKCRFG